MIIKLTVNDNDFYNIMYNFIIKMWHYTDTKYSKDLSPDELNQLIKEIDEHDAIIRLINPNIDTKLSKENEDKVIEYIKKNFERYLDKHASKDTKEYLLKNLKISFQESFKDKWENGEAFYWCQHSGAVINQ